LLENGIEIGTARKRQRGDAGEAHAPVRRTPLDSGSRTRSGYFAAAACCFLSDALFIFQSV
jgi:hypothetical protein